MESSLSAIPAGCGVVMYYFIRFLRSQSTILVNPDLEMTDKLQIMADGLVQNWGMWIAVVAFVAVILLVHLIRTRSFDHAWRISIITGGVNTNVTFCSPLNLRKKIIIRRIRTSINAAISIPSA